LRERSRIIGIDIQLSIPKLLPSGSWAHRSRILKSSPSSESFSRIIHLLKKY